MRSRSSTVARALTATTGAGALLGTAGVAYAAGIEVRAYTLRRVELPILPARRETVRVLHLSDLHMTPGQTKKQHWVRQLGDLQPDLVVNTGDNLAHQESVPAVLGALRGLLGAPGVFVLGSNDYFAPSKRNPVKYLLPDDGKRNTHTPKLPWPELCDGFEASGWRNLNNRRDTLSVKGTTFAFAGVDDPHLQYDDLGAVAGRALPATAPRSSYCRCGSSTPAKANVVPFTLSVSLRLLRFLQPLASNPSHSSGQGSFGVCVLRLPSSGSRYFTGLRLEGAK